VQSNLAVRFHRYLVHLVPSSGTQKLLIQGDNKENSEVSPGEILIKFHITALVSQRCYNCSKNYIQREAIKN